MWCCAAAGKVLNVPAKVSSQRKDCVSAFHRIIALEICSILPAQMIADIQEFRTNSFRIFSGYQIVYDSKPVLLLK